MTTRFVPVVAVMEFTDYEVLARYIEQTELPAEVRELLPSLLRSTKEAIMLGSLLSQCAKIVAQEGLP